MSYLDPPKEYLCLDKFLRDDAVHSLGKSLCESNFDRLILRGNYIGPNGAGVIANVLKVNMRLQHVSLEWNQIGCQGAAKLAEALSMNIGLISLDLRNNEIGDEGAIALANVMTHNDTLKAVDLRWNKIGDRGALAFEHAVTTRKLSLLIQLSGNTLTPAGMSEMENWKVCERYQSCAVSEIEAQPISILTIQSTPQLDSEREKLLSLEATQPTESCKSQIAASLEMIHNMTKLKLENEMLTEEVSRLRQQCMDIQSNYEDILRQSHASALKITELEQLYRREAFRNGQLSESLKRVSERLSSVLDEQSRQVNTWEMERSDLTSSLQRVEIEKNTDIQNLTAERDALRDRLSRAQTDHQQQASQHLVIVTSWAEANSQIQVELKLASTNINELSSSEAALRADNGSLQRNLESAQQAVKGLSQQLHATQAERCDALAALDKQHALAVAQLRDELASQSLFWNEKHSRQQQDNLDLQTQISSLQHQHDSQILELQISCQQQVKSVRDAEKVNLTQTIENFNQRIVLLTEACEESNNRDNAKLLDIQSLKDEYTGALGQWRDQLAAVEADSLRSRSECVELRDKAASLQSDLRKTLWEKEEAVKRVDAALSQARASQDLAASHLATKQSLLTRIATLESQVHSEQQARLADFESITSRVTTAVGNEFEMFRLSLVAKKTQNQLSTSHSNFDEEDFNGHEITDEN